MLTLNRALLSDLYSHLFGEALPPRFLFGVRGAVPTSPGSLTLQPVTQQIDHYDDAIGFMVDGNGHTYQGSVDPGRFFTLHPMDSAGCAHVIEGRYPFEKGPHKGKPAWKGIDVHCWRDRNKDGTQNPSERKVFIVRTSIDLHYGGISNTVGEFSAGCQVVRQPHWDSYRPLTYELFGERAEYWLIHYDALSEAQGGQRSPSVTINGVPIPKTCPMWISEQLHLVAVARDFLAHLQLNDAPPAFDYQESTSSLVFPDGATVPGKLVSDRLVCEVAALLKALDADVGIQWNAAEKRVTVTSERLKEANPDTEVLPRLAEADDDRAIPDTV